MSLREFWLVFGPFVGVVVGALASFGGQWYALRHQQRAWVTQRWWERKAETYSELIEALWHLLEFSRWAEDHLDAQRRSAEPAERPIEHDYLVHRAELQKLADIGAFVISDEVFAAVQQYLSATNKSKDEMEAMEDDDLVDLHLQQTRICLDEVRAGAAKDLRISGATVRP